MEKWQGKVAVVTGAASGIGKAILLEFAKNGINVIGLDRQNEKIDELSNEFSNLKDKIYAYKCDVSDLESVKSAFKLIEDKFGSIHILVNNAGAIFAGDIMDEGEEADRGLNNVIDTNLKGVMNCSRAGIKLMKKSEDHGIIINIISIAGHNVPNLPCVNVYSASKFGIRAFAEALRFELVRTNLNIRVSSISPGSVKTEMSRAAMKFSRPNVFEKHNDDSICWLQPEDVAQTARFLLEVPFSVNITELIIKPTGERF